MHGVQVRRTRCRPQRCLIAIGSSAGHSCERDALRRGPLRGSESGASLRYANARLGRIRARRGSTELYERERDRQSASKCLSVDRFPCFGVFTRRVI